MPTRDRAAVGLMLAGLDGAIDVIVPRGGKSLVARVQAEARVPVFAHLEGVCHVYVDKAADLDMAQGDRAQRQDAAHRRLRRGRDAAGRSRRRGDASASRWSRCCSRPAARCAATRRRRPPIARVQAGERGGLVDRISRRRSSPRRWSTASTPRSQHIERYGSHHTDAIVTADQAAAEKFLAEVDSAIVLHNASTQFADGGEFGFGAEIGIATGRMHARGRSASSSSTTFKYRVRGSGQTRP